jgi:hypothetical protein
LIGFSEIVMQIKPQCVRLFVVLKCKGLVIKWVIKFFWNMGWVLKSRMPAAKVFVAHLLVIENGYNFEMNLGILYIVQPTSAVYPIDRAMNEGWRRLQAIFDRFDGQRDTVTLSRRGQTHLQIEQLL